MSDSDTRGGVRKRAIMMGSLAVLVAAVAVFLATSSSDEDDDAAIHAESLWYCPDCRHAIQRTGEVAIAYQKFSSTDQPGSGPAPRKAREGIPVGKCERCSKWTARAATKCAKCGEVYPTRMDDGKRAACPKCGAASGSGKSSGESDEQKSITPAY